MTTDNPQRNYSLWVLIKGLDLLTSQQSKGRELNYMYYLIFCSKFSLNMICQLLFQVQKFHIVGATSLITKGHYNLQVLLEMENW